MLLAIKIEIFIYQICIILYTNLKYFYIVEYFSNAPFLKNNGAFEQNYEVTGGF